VFIERSDKMRALLRGVRSHARSDAAIVIVGERASGRKRLGEWVHEQSNRSGGPFVTLGCKSLGSDPVKVAREAMSKADGGTLIVDVEDVERDVGARIAGELSRSRASSYGSSAWGVRLIVVDHEILGVARKLVKDATWVAMPPLRERKEDIVELFWEFLEEATIESDHDDPDVAPEVFDAVEAYAWPNNFAEFRSAVERAALVARKRAKIDLADFPLAVRAARREAEVETVRPLAVMEREYIVNVLHRFGGRRGEAARALGLSRSTLLRRLRDFGLVQPRSSSPRRR
jgi:DNA-binding NtrC family response regulator